MTQLQLLRADEAHGQCTDCRREVRVFRYPDRQAPHWYTIEHRHSGGWCTGGGWPVFGPIHWRAR